MINFMQSNKTQKRNIEDDRSDNYNYIPSLKRIKMKNFDEDTEQSLYVEENNMLTFVQNETPSILTNEHKEFSNICTGINNEFIINSNPIFTAQQSNLFESNGINFQQMEFKYMPDLNAAENPYYYEYNKLLFELYVERLQRSIIQNIQLTRPPL